MLKRCRRACQLAGEHANLAGDFAGGEIAVDPHLAGQAERALHRAADLGGDAEGHVASARSSAGFGDADGLDVLAVAEPRAGTWRCRRPIARGGPPAAWRCRSGPRARAKLAAQIAHEREIDDAAPVDPLKNLPGVEARLPEIVECLFQFGQFEPAMSVRVGVTMAHPPEERTSILLREASPALRTAGGPRTCRTTDRIAAS